MLTIDSLLLKIVNLTSPSLEDLVPFKDAKLLRSLATSVSGDKFITENQSKLIVKVLRENQGKIQEFFEELESSLELPTWSKDFRRIQQVRKIYTHKDANNDSLIYVEFTYSSEIKKVLNDLSRKTENLIPLINNKIYTADLTERNVVNLVDTLTPFNFEIDESLKGFYDTIKSWSETEISDQFLLTNIVNQNFQKYITADLGLETAIDQRIINDRSMRYQYRVSSPKNPGETLTEYIANRGNAKVWVDKKQHSLADIIRSLRELRRMPLLVVFDSMINNKYYENMVILKEAIEENNLHNSVGIYFRLDNDELGKQFNTLISENKFNKELTQSTDVAGVQSGKLPKFFLKNAWRPMSVIALDSRMGMRHGKTAVYSNCCDLIVEWSDEPPLLDRKVN